MKLSEARSVGIFRVTVDLSEFFDGKAQHIKLREPTLDELQTFNQAEEGKRMDALRALFPVCFVESSFQDETGKPASAEDVEAFLLESAVMYTHVMKTWQEALPLEKRRAGKSVS